MTETQDRVVNFYAEYSEAPGVGRDECRLVNGGTWPAQDVRIGVRAAGVEVEVGPSSLTEVGPREAVVVRVRIPSGAADALVIVSWKDHMGQRRSESFGPPQNAVH